MRVVCVAAADAIGWRWCIHIIRVVMYHAGKTFRFVCRIGEFGVRMRVYVCVYVFLCVGFVVCCGMLYVGIGIGCVAD